MLDTNPLVPDKYCYLLTVSDTSFVPPQVPSTLSPPGPQAACSVSAASPAYQDHPDPTFRAAWGQLVACLGMLGPCPRPLLCSQANQMQV